MGKHANRPRNSNSLQPSKTVLKRFKIEFDPEEDGNHADILSEIKRINSKKRSKETLGVMCGYVIVFLYSWNNLTKGRMIDAYRASNNSVSAVCISTGCTVGICRTILVLLCFSEIKFLRRFAILSLSYKQ